MSLLPKHLIRYALALLGTAVVAGCSSSGTDNNNTGAISLALTPTSASVQQGAQATTTGTLTRSGGFTGTVNLTVTGAPTGVTAAVSNVVTTGLVTTATITVTVGATTTPGTYPIVVHGNGTGVTEATATYTLTVTALPAAYTLTLSASTLSIVQGGATPTTTVTLGRTNFPGNVTLSVDNLPTGVTAAFNPANPISGDNSVLTLTVSPTAPTGTFNNLAVRGVATGLTDRTAPLTLTITAAGSFTLSVSPAGGVSLVQGTSDNSKTINISRNNYGAAITLTAEGLPAGVTAAFAGSPTLLNSSVLTLTATAGATVGGPVTVTIRGTGPAALRAPGGAADVEATTTLSLTVTAAVAGNFSLTTTPATSVSITQGASTPTVTVNINRTGGNTSNVTLTTTGTLGTGMTAVFVPNPTNANSSVLTITTTGATPTGSYPIVIHGNATGLAEQTVNLTINVTAPSGGGNASVSFAGCTTDNKAVWFAFQDGTAGTWTAVTGVADVYQFNITQSKGGIAYVVLGTGSSTINVQYFTQAELTAGVLNFCTAALPAGKTVNGTVSNLPGGLIGRVSFARSGASVFANGAFQILNAQDGNFDLIGYASSVSIGSTDRVFVKRGENPAAGGSFSVPVNFTDGTLSSSPAAASVALNGLVGGETLSHGMTFYTQGTACVPATLYSASPAGSSFIMYGVPPSLRVGTDMHSINITALNGTTSFRSLIENFLDIATRAATPFVLPAQLPVPVATDAGGPYKRPSIAVTGVPAELNLSHTMTYTDNTVTGKAGVVSATQGWVGAAGSNVTLVLPNFAGVGTFNNAWAAASGDALNWTMSSSGGTFTGACAAGQRFVSSTRTGTL